MPLPLGHTAIGLLTHDIIEPPQAVQSDGTGPVVPFLGSRLKTFLLVTLLANLPDMDVIVGLLVDGNGSLFTADRPTACSSPSWPER